MTQQAQQEDPILEIKLSEVQAVLTFIANAKTEYPVGQVVNLVDALRNLKMKEVESDNDKPQEGDI